MKESTIACKLDSDASDSEQLERYRKVWQKVGADVQEIKELPNGYSFRFLPAQSVILNIAEFIILERLCCSFFTFVLKVEEGEGGAVWLNLTGPEGVKHFLRSELGM